MGALSDCLRRLNRAPLWQTTLPVWGQRLVIPTADRLLYALLHAAGLMGKGDRRFFEAELRPGMTVLDVGANIGLYALLFARLVGSTGKVYAFEPDPQLYGALERAAALNRCANLQTFPHGLSEKTERGALQQSFFNSGDNRVRPASGAGAAIALARGDDLLPAQSADFIKIDVQGYELRALRGLRGLISRSPRVQIYLEFWPEGLRLAGSEPHDLFDFLADAGFTLSRWRGGAWEPSPSGGELAASLKGQRFVNLRARKCA